jgi:hypothetical protein
LNADIYVGRKSAKDTVAREIEKINGVWTCQLCETRPAARPLRADTTNARIVPGELFDRIEQMPARTLAGMQAKARVLARYNDNDISTDEAETHERRITFSLARDLLALGT